MLKHFVLLLASSAAFAGELDKTLIKVNQDLNPKSTDEVGYEVDYRQETAGQVDTWINITQVRFVCGSEQTSYLKDNKIVTTTENRCGNRGILSSTSLLQIFCFKSRGKECMQTLAKETSTAVIKLMIANKLTRVYVK